MKTFKVESCFMCPVSDVRKQGTKIIVQCCHDDVVDRWGVGIDTGMGTEGIWDECPLEQDLTPALELLQGIEECVLWVRSTGLVICDRAHNEIASGKTIKELLINLVKEGIK